MYRLDLHTHSIISYDGGIGLSEYRQLLSDPNVVLAITDHNQISFALELHMELGNRVIIGEEILTQEGEVIGLFLNQLVQPKLPLSEAVSQIRKQGGLVYIPHPFEKTRKGLSQASLEKIVGEIDIMEVFNARSREPWLTRKTEKFALEHKIASASSSDAHSISGFGTAFSNISELPTSQNLANLTGGKFADIAKGCAKSAYTMRIRARC